MLTKITYALLLITIGTGLALSADSVENNAQLYMQSLVHEPTIGNAIVQNSIEYLTWTLTGAMATTVFVGALLKGAENNDRINKSVFLVVAYSTLAQISLGIAIPAGYFYLKSLGNLLRNCYLLTLSYAPKNNASAVAIS